MQFWNHKHESSILRLIAPKSIDPKIRWFKTGMVNGGQCHLGTLQPRKIDHGQSLSNRWFHRSTLSHIRMSAHPMG